MPAQQKQDHSLPLGVKMTYFTPDSTYHGGPGEGYGKRSFNSGQYVEGHWKDEEQEGFGSLTTKEGSSYTGEWQRGIMHGEGKYAFQKAQGKFGQNATGQSGYVGQWSDGKFHGRGRRVLYNGNDYDGEWKKNKRHGWGMYRVANPTVGGLAAYEGEWVSDARTGKGISKGTDGHLEVCTYENGLRRGEGVRIIDKTVLKGCLKDERAYKLSHLRLVDGEEMEELEEAEAEALAAKIGISPLPSHPWPPPAPEWELAEQSSAKP